MDKQSSLAAFLEKYFQAFQSDSCVVLGPHSIDKYRRLINKPFGLVNRDAFNSMGFQIAYKRFHEHSDEKMDLSLIGYIAAHANIPGEVVMFCTYCYLKGIKDIDQFFLEMGAVSYPRNEDFVAAWDSQKCDSGNALDDGKAVLAYRQKLLE